MSGPRDALVTGLAGVAVLAPIELWRGLAGGMGWRVWGVAGLLASLGLAIALGLLGGERLTRRWAGTPGERGVWARALARSLPAVLVLGPLGSTIFDGARASTWPMAGHAWWWLPLVGVALLAAVVRLGSWLSARWSVAGVGAALVCLSLLLDVANRSVLRSEYLDLHTAAVIAAAVAAGLGVRACALAALPLGGRWPVGGTAEWVRPVASALVALTLITFMAGLEDKRSRRAVQAETMHARLLTRVARSVVDLDRDGHSTVLGGGECHDLDPDVHPGAREQPGNGRDEDCDGRDVAPASSGGWGRAAAGQRAQALAGWRERPESRALLSRWERLDVLLVVVDGLRADPLADTPANRAAYPGFFRFLDGARRFERAFSPAAGTDLSMAGLFTGKTDPVSRAEGTLAEALADAGYQGYAVVPAEVMRAGSQTLFSRGFSRQDVLVTDPIERDVGARISSSRVTDKGLAFLREQARRRSGGRADPFLLWLHYFDVHEHHQIPADHREVVEAGTRIAGAAPRTPAERYRAMVAVVDRALGRLWSGLDESGLAESTLVVLLSDHGESLGEDPRLPDNHGRVLYGPLVHVPLAFRAPGVPPGRLWQPVSLLDVGRTVLDVVGVTGGLPAGDGESLLPQLAGGQDRPAARALPLNESEQFGVVLWPHKLLVRPQDNVTELYDLSRDPSEQHDLAEAEPDRVRELLAAYRSFPAPTLDRTRRGRARWEENMRASVRGMKRRQVAVTSGAPASPRGTFAP